MNITRIDVTISTDGACKGNPGPGGHSAKLRIGDRYKEVAGYSEHSTNNREELLGVILGVQNLTKPCNILFRLDSKYVCTGLSNLRTWYNNGWKTKSGAPVKNADLWQLLAKLGIDGKHKYRFQYVEGHNGDQDNERCDFLAKEQIRIHGGK